jgi:hypothetical protein
MNLDECRRIVHPCILILSEKWCMMSGKNLFVLSILAICSTASVAQACNLEAAEAYIKNEFGSRIANSDGGTCEVARIQIEMFEYAKGEYAACLVGQSLDEQLAILDEGIARAQQSMIDVGGC